MPILRYIEQKIAALRDAEENAIQARLSGPEAELPPHVQKNYDVRADVASQVSNATVPVLEDLQRRILAIQIYSRVMRKELLIGGSVMTAILAFIFLPRHSSNTPQPNATLAQSQSLIAATPPQAPQRTYNPPPVRRNFGQQPVSGIIVLPDEDTDVVLPPGFGKTSDVPEAQLTEDFIKGFADASESNEKMAKFADKMEALRDRLFAEAHKELTSDNAASTPRNAAPKRQSRHTPAP